MGVPVERTSVKRDTAGSEEHGVGHRDPVFGADPALRLPLNAIIATRGAMPGAADRNGDRAEGQVTVALEPGEPLGEGDAGVRPLWARWKG